MRLFRRPTILDQGPQTMPALASLVLMICITLSPLGVSWAQEITTEPLPGDNVVVGDPVDPAAVDGEELLEEEEEERLGADVYTVTDIPVDVTALTTTEARELAFAEGRREGLLLLGEDLGLASFPVTVGRLSDEEVDRLVQSFSVANERTTPGRYVADLTFVYEPTAVRALLREGRLASANANDGVVVIIPVFETPGGPRLWDPPNPWLDAWLFYDPAQYPTEILLPFGDVADVSDISAQAAVLPDGVAVNRMAERYGAGRGAVAIVRNQGSALGVTLTMTQATAIQWSDTFVVPLPVGSAEDEGLQLAVQEVARRIDEAPVVQPSLAAVSPLAGGSAVGLTVSVPINSPGDWYRVVETLDRLPIIVGNTLLSLGPREAIVRIEHVGTENDLRLVLAEQALDLRSAGGFSELIPLLP